MEIPTDQMSPQKEKVVKVSMFSETRLLVQGPTTAATPLLDLLKQEIEREGYRRLSACAAYASVGGVIALRDLFSELYEASYRWLLGTSDNWTHPGALRIAEGSINAEVRVPDPARDGRFHAKVYLLDSSPNGHATLVIGSGNATHTGMSTNCEAYAAFICRKKKETRRAERYWQVFWKMGRLLTTQYLQDYEKEYSRAQSLGAAIARDDEKDTIDADSVARTLNTGRLAWIVLARNTGFHGEQLDIVKALAPFLRLPANPSEGTNTTRHIQTALGVKSYELRFLKGMWRFMNLQQGFGAPIRPDMHQPSPYILVMERTKKAPRMKMRTIRCDSPKANAIIERSKASGFVGKSVAAPWGRRYGWW